MIEDMRTVFLDQKTPELIQELTDQGFVYRSGIQQAPVNGAPFSPYEIWVKYKSDSSN